MSDVIMKTSQRKRRSDATHGQGADLTCIPGHVPPELASYDPTRLQAEDLVPVNEPVPDRPDDILDPDSEKRVRTATLTATMAQTAMDTSPHSPGPSRPHSVTQRMRREQRIRALKARVAELEDALRVVHDEAQELSVQEPFHYTILVTTERALKCAEGRADA